MDDWKLEIIKVTNGYLLKGKFNDSDYVQTVVIEEKTNNDFGAMQEVLYIIKEYFGIYYSNHNKENLIIEIEKNEEKE